jgi:hypothetical protein
MAQDPKLAALTQLMISSIEASLNARLPALTSAIDQVGADLTRMIAEIQTSIVAARTDIGVLGARLEMLEAGLGSNVKRTVHTAAPRAAIPKGNGKAPAKKAADTVDYTKITNVLLFFKHAMGLDVENIREVYATESLLAIAEADPTVMKKKNEDPDSPAYWSAVANVLWKSSLNDASKNEVRTRFSRWKEAMKRLEDNPDLQEEVYNDE